MTVELSWTPQRLVWIGLAVSAAVVLLCVGILLVTRRRRRARAQDGTDADAHVDAPALDLTFTYAGSNPLVVTALLAGVAVGIGTAVVSRAWIGAVAGVATVVVTLVPRARIAVAIAIPVVLALSRIVDEPELAWLTIALLVVDLAARWVRRRTRSHVTPEPAVVPESR